MTLLKYVNDFLWPSPCDCHTCIFGDPALILTPNLIYNNGSVPWDKECDGL